MTSLDKQIQWIKYIIGYMDINKNMLMTGYIISKNFKALLLPYSTNSIIYNSD